MQSPQSLNFLLISWLFLAGQDRAQVPGPEDIQGRHPSGDGHLAPEDSEEQPAVDKDARPARDRVLEQVRVELEQLDGLVVGAGGDQVARRVPGRAVDGAVVVLALLVEDGG